jgi:hypothetical protein
MLHNIMVFQDFEPWLGQVYPRRNLSIVVLVVRRTKKEGDLRKGRKGNMKTIMYSIKGPPGWILGPSTY